jgi:hypothetical protein
MSAGKSMETPLFVGSTSLGSFAELTAGELGVARLGNYLRAHPVTLKAPALT